MDKTIRRWYRDSVLTNGYKHRAPGTLQRLFQVEVGRFGFFLCVYFWLQREVKASFVLSLHPFQSVLLFLDLWNLAVAAGTCWGDTWAPERFQAERRSALVKTHHSHIQHGACFFFFFLLWKHLIIRIVISFFWKYRHLKCYQVVHLSSSTPDLM